MQSGLSIDMQISRGIQYCALYDIEPVVVYGDGISGKNFEDRPGAMAVLDLVERGLVSHLIVWRLDRFARNTKEALDTEKQLRENEVVLHSLTERLDTSTATGRLFFTFMAALAQWERETVSERTIENLARKKERGGRISRYAPLGYCFEGDDVVIDPREQEAIERAIDLRIGQFSYNEISELLFEEGYVARSGNPYSKSVVRKMVREKSEQPGNN